MAETLMLRFGKRVRILRLKRDWRQDDLAAHAEISRQHISAIELGQREVCLNTIQRLADAFEVQPYELLR